MKTIVTATIFIFVVVPAYATGRLPIEKGFYVPSFDDCDMISTAAGIYYDGVDLNGHYQLCAPMSNDPVTAGKTTTITSSCIETMGGDTRTRADIERSPDKESVSYIITITSRTAFTLNKTAYKFCPGG